MKLSRSDLDEAVRLSDWNSAWPARARAIGEAVAAALSQPAPIEHIGSTAIEGMRAKPVIDLMVGAPDAARQEDFAQLLCRSDWQDLGEAGVLGRRHLRRRETEAANLHIVLHGGPHWTNNLAIRDYLRAHPPERDAYAALKAESLAAGADRLLAYSDRKAPFLRALLQRALAWRDAEGARGSDRFIG